MARDLIKRVPKYYRNSQVMKELFKAAELALDSAEKKVVTVDAECLISTATESISRWETIYGIPPSNEDIQRRRERVLARKRGGGNNTIEHLKNVIAAFTNGEAEVEEIYNEYRVVILFNDLHGAPPYMEDVLAAIDDIIPAHIEVTISISVELKSKAFTFAGGVETETVTEIY